MKNKEYYFDVIYEEKDSYFVSYCEKGTENDRPIWEDATFKTSDLEEYVLTNGLNEDICPEGEIITIPLEVYMDKCIKNILTYKINLEK